MTANTADFLDELAKRDPRTAERLRKAEAAQRFAPVTVSNFPEPQLPRLIRKFVAHRELVLIYGGWGSGKSFFTIDMACCVGCGDQWRGRPVDAGAVVYVAGEAAGAIQGRVRAWLLRKNKLGKGKPEPPVGVIGSAPDLLHGEDDMRAVSDAVEAFGTAVGRPVRLVIFDTLHACAPGSKEDTADTGTVLARVRPLTVRFGCAVCVVHHSGKDSARGARGSNSLEAAADLIVEVVEDGPLRTPIVRKMRDGEPPELEPFVIDGVTLGHDAESGEPIRAGVHELTEPKADPRDPRKARARTMRKEGASYEAIAKALGVAKSCAWKWCHG